MSRNNNSWEVLDIALGRGAKLLLALMAAAFVVFCFSNIFWVEEGFVAIRCRFGDISGNDDYVITPGGPHFALPYPMDKVVKIPTTRQSVSTENAFCAIGTAVNGNAGTVYYYGQPGAPLTQLLPGSLITGDKNVVQGQWTADYQIDVTKLKTFATNVGGLDNAKTLIRSALEQAVIKVVSGMSVDEFVKGNIDNAEIRRLAQAALDDVPSGLIINHVSSNSYGVPEVLREAFLQVNKAESEKATQIEKAKRFREATLNTAAGGAWSEILAAIDDYENNHDYSRLKGAFESSMISGSISKPLTEARIYRTEVVQKTKSDAERFEKLLEQHRENAKILENRLLQDAVQTIFSGNVKTFYLPQDKDKTLYMELNTN
ncbi:MAG: SPFH domain-containing protein [Victivallaceae bacterium]|nr:SPFH domain-containing protein [Victivallaceae bacterium]